MRLSQHRRIVPPIVMVKSLFLVMAVALLGNMFMTHQVAAGGPIMTGTTFVSGTDESTGKSVKDPRTQLFPQPTVLPVFKNDKVTFYAHIQNWDPFPIPGPVNIQIHRVDFANSDTLATDGEKDLTPTGPLGFWWYKGNNILQSESWSETINGPGTDTPGNQMCYYVQTNPTMYDFTDVLIFQSPVVVGLHKFNSHNDSYDLDSSFFLSVFTLNLLKSIPLGDMMSCVEIAYNYNLMPSIDLNGGGSNGSVNVSTAVSQGPINEGSSATYTKKTQWQVSQFYLPADQAAPGVTTSTKDPCTYFAQNTPAQSCIIPKLADGKTPAASDGTNTIFNPDGSFKSGTSLPSALSAPDDPPEGYVVCYALSVKSYKPYLDPAAWRNSAVVCPDLATKKPKVQILGDDVRVGGKINTSQTITTEDNLTKLFGSWGQYASYSVGPTIGFGTQSGLAGGIASGMPQSEWGKLTFANAQGQYGYFSANVASAGAIASKNLFTANAKSDPSIGNSITLSDLSGSKTPYLVQNGSTTLNIKGGSDIAKGKTIIIVASGTVKITGDITYTSDALSSIKDIPQVVIVAPNILINPGVQHIDAWLIADYQTGTINTCNQNKTLTSLICDNPLRVNGPVVTDKLLLNRTSGSESDDPGKPAETFDNNGISYLWAQNYSQGSGSLQTTNQMEMPPRF